MGGRQRKIVFGAAALLLFAGLVFMVRSYAATGEPAFDKARAMNHLREICAIGPRISGTPGMQKQIVLLKKGFEEAGLSVELQKFEAKQRSRPQAVEMCNLIARWKPEEKRRLLLCTHYDTRPLADQEPNPRDWEKPFLGANDGASGPALMLELARQLKALNPALGVDFVCFDGEEYVFSQIPSDQGGDRYFIGSEHFAGKYLGALRENQEAPRYVEAILLDMVAGKNSKFFFEEHSAMRAGPLVEKIWKLAQDVGAKRFVPQYGVGVLDDHLSLLNAGILAIDIVPALDRRRVNRFGDPFLDYPHWHRLSDLPENCSPETMEEVARVLIAWLKQAK